jgi:penicillin-binding protein 1A
MGFDAKVSLGKQEYGGTAALPVWMDFMGEALRNEPLTAFSPPPGVVFWEATAQPGPDNLERLFEFGPDLDPNFATKQNCPVDETYLVTTPYHDPYTMMGMPNYGMQAMTQQGSMRILSADGKTLGYGFPFRDDTGKASIYRDPVYAQSQDSFRAYDPYQRGFYNPANPYAQGMPRSGMNPYQSNPYYQQDGGGYGSVE